MFDYSVVFTPPPFTTSSRSTPALLDVTACSVKVYFNVSLHVKCYLIVSYPRELVLYVWDQDGPPPINPEMRMLRHRVAINKGKSEKHMLNSKKNNILL